MILGSEVLQTQDRYEYLNYVHTYSDGECRVFNESGVKRLTNRGNVSGYKSSVMITLCYLSLVTSRIRTLALYTGLFSGQRSFQRLPCNRSISIRVF